MSPLFLLSRWSMCTLARCSMWTEPEMQPSPHPTCEKKSKLLWLIITHLSEMLSDNHDQSYVSLCVFFSFLSSRSSNYPFSDSPLYSQTPPMSSSTYYEDTPGSESDISGAVTSVSVATGGANGGAAAAGGVGYVVQGSYVLGGGGGGGGASAGGGGGGQSYTSPNSRAPPATVSAQVVKWKNVRNHNLWHEGSKMYMVRPTIFRCSGCVITTRGRRGWVYLAVPFTTTTCCTARSRN